MYLRFYGLREEPFGVTPDPRFLYASPTYQEAQATLEYGIRSGRGFTALIAKPGMGKTTLLFHLLERYSRSARTAFIFLTQCDSREFLRYLMTELGADTNETDFVRLQDQFGQLLVREAQAGKKVIAVVDEAQNLDTSVLETVRLLSDFETPRAKLLHIILTGQPELADRLASPALLQLRQRISHLVRLEPLNAADVSRYIDHRLRLAGYLGAPLFTPEARSLIAERSEGIPRTINNLCFNALSLGCALSRKTIGADILAEVSADLDFESLIRSRQEEATAAANLAAASSVAAPSTPPAGASPQEASTPKAAVPGPEVATVPPQPTASGSETAPSPLVANGVGGQQAAREGGGRSQELPPQDEIPVRIAAIAPADVAAETAPAAAAMTADLAREEAKVPSTPGPVLVPDLPAVAAAPSDTREVASAEVGNLALRIMPAETVAENAAAPVPMNGTGKGAAIPDNGAGGGAGAPPANGAGAPAAGDQKKASGVDVEALAADCALFGMEAPRRWKRPVGKIPLTAAAGAAPARPRVGEAVPPRAPVARPVVAPMAAGATTAAPGNGNSARAAVTPISQPPGRPPAPTGAGKLWPPRPPAATNGRKRRNQRTMYVAAGASLLLLLLLVWLLGSSGPATTSAPQATAAVENANPQPDAGDAAATPSDSSVLDVVEELPRPGDDPGLQDTKPAVVMRGTRAGDELLRRVDPVYPAAARANRIQGAVVLVATIGTHGFLRHIRVVSGDPLLADSVLDAVKGWRYRTHKVRGRTVETETRIVVNFQLAPSPPNTQQSQ